MENLLRRQEAFSDLVATILSRFASSVASDLDKHIQVSLGEIARFVSIEYAYLVHTSPDHSLWSVTHEWCAPGSPSLLGRYQNIAMGTFHWAEQVLLAGETLLLNSLDDIPLEHSETRAQIEATGFKSNLQLPLFGEDGRVNGCIALSALQGEIKWSEADIQRLRLVGNSIANALSRKRTEEELRMSECRYRTTFEQAPIGILNLSSDGSIVKANERFCNLLGYRLEELLGRPCSELTHADDLDAFRMKFDELLNSRAPRAALAKRYMHKSGGMVWVKESLSLLAIQMVETETGFMDPDQPFTIIATVEDVTDRKQAEDTFDAVPDLIFVMDNQHRVIRANRSAAKRLGMALEDLLGRPCHEVIHGTPSPPDYCPHAKSLSDRNEHRLEIHEPRLGGDFLISCSPLSDSSGQPAGTVHVLRDVTELRRSENALRLAHEELMRRRALVVAASLDGIWEWDATSDQVQYSERFAELLGYQTTELPQTLDFFRRILHPDDSEMLWASVDQHLTEGVPHDVECRLQTKSGNYRWFQTRGQAQRDVEGRPTWMAGSLQDVHDRKMAEAELRGALKEVDRLTDQLRAENVYLQEEIASSQGFDEIVGQSVPLRSTLTKIEHVADTDASVLLLGETGTGKELLARAVHSRSRRKDRPLVKVNLAALTASLIESELFGHVRGAFTGAIADKIGRFELADGGTLFLDEIGELNPELQTKLLRVLQEGEFERIGSGKTLRVDVRVVAATNRDLHLAMEQEKFRPDLYYRLAVFPIEVPPLRLRRDDIPLLIWHFISKKQVRLGKTISSVPQNVMNTLVEYDWPGNIRELENVVERAMILSSGSTLMLEGSFRPMRPSVPKVQSTNPPDVNRDRIISVLQECHWRIKGTGNAAERLGLQPSTLRYRMKTLGIQRPAE
jgi:formate hydrogenlyase transcriptional activator